MVNGERVKMESKTNIKNKKHFNSDALFTFIVYAIVIILTIIVFYILYFVVIASFSDPNAVATGKVILIPKGINFDCYKFIFRDKRIWTGYYNTIRYTFFGTIIGLITTIPAGYALSRKDFKGRGVIMKIAVFTMFFSGGLIPTYYVVDKLHLVNTPYVLMILGSFNVFNLILTRTYFMNTLPVELQEAAEVDGCSIPRFFFSIVLPLSKAIIAIIALYYAVAHWNAYFNALVYINDSKLYPLQLILRDILIQGQTVQSEGIDAETLAYMMQLSKTIKYGVIIVSSLPVIMLYPFVQKYFVKGVMVGSIKG